MFDSVSRDIFLHKYKHGKTYGNTKLQGLVGLVLKQQDGIHANFDRYYIIRSLV